MQSGHLILLTALCQIVMIAKMFPFSWQRSVFDQTDFYSPFQRWGFTAKKEYLDKLRLCWLAAFILYNGALFARFEYCIAHLSVKPFSGKIALTFKGMMIPIRAGQFYIVPLPVSILTSYGIYWLIE